jgi:hypothetical protein
MRTPAGRECRHYYGDFHRGRQAQECRLLARNSESEPWTPDLCAGCPVPDILMANACPNLVLNARVVKRFLGLSRRVEVEGWCSATFLEVENPEVGCGHCHEHRPGASVWDDVQIAPDE